MDVILQEITLANIMAILFLIVLEGMLSIDNSIALAALVKSRLSDPHDQKKALTYGIWGAYFFRIIIVFCGVWLMKFWQIKLGAGLYLIWLGVNELLPKINFENKNEDKVEKENTGFSLKWLSPLWSTIASVEIMDFMFSIDSIGAALAISNVKWVLITGAIIGILMMRVAANLFIHLIDKYPILEKTAFLLVLIAGIGVSLKAFHIEIPEIPFMGTLISILLGSIYLNHKFPTKVKTFLETYY